MNQIQHHAKARPQRGTSADFILERVIQLGLLVLLALMPFHAFLSVWLGHVFGHQALIQSWKEALIVLLAPLAVMLVVRQPERRRQLAQPWLLAGVAFGAVALILTAVVLTRHQLTLTQVLFGAKIDLEFMVVAIMAAVVGTRRFVVVALGITLAAAIMVAIFSFMQVYVLPPRFLEQFGYGSTTILPFLYLTGAPGVMRFASTLGGPNQLGTYLILPLCVAAVCITTQWRWAAAALIPLVFAMIHTYSRSAWIGSFLALILLVVWLAPRASRRVLMLGLVAMALGGIFIISSVLTSHTALQEQLLHSTLQSHSLAGTSDVEHLLSLTNGINDVLDAPLGHGLGSAGPATFHTAKSTIIENQFLQIGYETGWLGLGLFLGFLGAIVYALMRATEQPWAKAAGAAIIGVSLAGLFIPTWDDSSTALIAFAIAGALTALPKLPRNSDV